jgi:SAM-dependent methyltransferase
VAHESRSAQKGSGAPEGYYGHIRKEILPLLPPRVDRILEVGCGTGETLAFLKNSGRCAWAGGVELSPSTAAQARTKGLDFLLEGSIADAVLPLAPQSLDIVLCLDVLEHLVDPHAVLCALRGYLKPGGLVICSIPNVRHARVVLPLLFAGDWTYKDDGILDRTHLRFFTRKTAVSLVQGAGFRIEAVRATGFDVGGKAFWVNLATLNLLRPLLEFQYLIKGRNGDFPSE